MFLSFSGISLFLNTSIFNFTCETIFSLISEEGLNFTTFREQIFATTFVFGFLPTLIFVGAPLIVPCLSYSPGALVPWVVSPGDVHNYY